MKLDERHIIPVFYIMTVKDYKREIIPNDSLNQANTIVVVQSKLQPKDQMQAVLPLRLTPLYRLECACLIWGIIIGSITYTCISWGITRYYATTKQLI